jgi:hypothetical protein
MNLFESASGLQSKTSHQPRAGVRLLSLRVSIVVNFPPTTSQCAVNFPRRRFTAPVAVSAWFGGFAVPVCPEVIPFQEARHS